MIRSIKVINDLKEELVFVLEEEYPSHGMIIKNITGLGPPKAAVTTSGEVYRDGSTLQIAKLSNRNIVIDMIFLPSLTIEETRLKSYKFFMPKKKIEFIVETDHRLLKTTGVIETNEPNIFSKEEGNQISIICTDPYFYSAHGSISSNLSYYNPLFEFPFSNESLLEPLLEFGNSDGEISTSIYYDGDYNIGLTFTIRILNFHFLGDEIVIYKVEDSTAFVLNVAKIVKIAGSFRSQDKIQIDTRTNRKTIKLFTAPFDGRFYEYNILTAMDEDRSTWLQSVSYTHLKLPTTSKV